MDKEIFYGYFTSENELLEAARAVNDSRQGMGIVYSYRAGGPRLFEGDRPARPALLFEVLPDGELRVRAGGSLDFVSSRLLGRSF